MDTTYRVYYLNDDERDYAGKVMLTNTRMVTVTRALRERGYLQLPRVSVGGDGYNLIVRHHGEPVLCVEGADHA